MKNLLVLFTAITFVISTSSTTDTVVANDIQIATLTFDGYEGDYFFFTNDKEEAIVLVLDDCASEDCKKLIENDFTGNAFKVEYVLSNKDLSKGKNGTIIHVTPKK